GRLDHVDEIPLAERRPLRLDRGAELLDLAVDLADPRRIVLDRLHPLRVEPREHDVGRHRGWPSRSALTARTLTGDLALPNPPMESTKSIPLAPRPVRPRRGSRLRQAARR